MASNPQVDPRMKGLISSIREQTTRLKSNLLTSKGGKALPPVPKGHLLDPKSNPDSERVATEGEEWTYSKRLIENLVEDNQMLREELEDYKRVTKILHAKCLELKRDLDLEKLKNSELEILHSQLTQSTQQIHHLSTQNLELKSKCLNLVELLRILSFEATEQEKEDCASLQKVSRENEFLRSLLQISRLSDSVQVEITEKLSTEECDLQSADYSKLIEGYRQQRQSRKSKSISIAGKKNYLLEEVAEKGAQSGVWENFFGAKLPAAKTK